jgi:hypothetical protein
VGHYNNFIGYEKGVLCYQKIKENIDFEWGWWTRGGKKEELIVLLCAINVRISPKQTKGDPGFTTDVTCLTPILQDKDVVEIHCRSVPETHINQENCSHVEQLCNLTRPNAFFFFFFSYSVVAC